MSNESDLIMQCIENLTDDCIELKNEIKDLEKEVKVYEPVISRLRELML